MKDRARVVDVHDLPGSALSATHFENASATGERDGSVRLNRDPWNTFASLP